MTLDRIVVVLAVASFACAPGSAGTLVPREEWISDADARLMLGRTLGYLGDVDEAIEIYEREVPAGAGDVATIELAELLLRAGRNARALEKLRALAARGSADARVHRLLARALLASGKPVEALREIDPLIAASPRDADLLITAAEAHAQLDHAARVRELYERALAIERTPERELAYADRMNQWGDFLRSRRRYGEILAKNAGDLEIERRRVRTYFSAERYDEAESGYRSLLARRPGFLAAKVGLAESELAARELPEAVRHAREALAQAPRSAEARAILAEALAIEQRIASGNTSVRTTAPAVVPASTASSSAGADSRASVREAELLAESGETARAILRFHEALKLDPDQFNARFELARALASVERHEEALAEIARLEAAAPGSYKLMIWRARILSWSRRWDEATRAYEAALREDPTDPIASRELARTSFWANRIGPSSTAYRRLASPAVDELLLARLRAVAPEARSPLAAELARLPAVAAAGAADRRGWSAYEALAAGEHARREPVAGILADLRDRYRIQKIMRLEEAAKQHTWRRHFYRARIAYDELLEAEPGNLEALFSLAQVHSTLQMPDHADASYRRLLALDPLHTLARRARHREALRLRPLGRAEHAFFEERGRGGLTDIAHNTSRVAGEWTFGPRHRARAGAAHWDDAAGIDGTDVEAAGPLLEADLRFDERFAVFGGVRRRDVNGPGFPSTTSGYLKVWRNFDDLVAVSLGYERADELHNLFGLQQGTQTTALSLGAQAELSHKVRVIATVSDLNTTDDNRGTHALLAAGYAFTEFPRVLKLTLQPEYRNFREDSTFTFIGDRLVNIRHPYFAPADYFSGTATIEWYHDVSELFFSAAQLSYYDVKISGGSDSRENGFLRGEIEVQHEFADRWTARLSGLAHRSREYDSDAVTVDVRYRF